MIIIDKRVVVLKSLTFIFLCMYFKTIIKSGRSDSNAVNKKSYNGSFRTFDVVFNTTLHPINMASGRFLVTVIFIYFISWVIFSIFS
jgi:hypothetical protein